MPAGSWSCELWSACWSDVIPRPRLQFGQIGLDPDLTCGSTDHGHGPVYALALSADGRLMASGGVDGTVRLSDVPGGRLVATHCRAMPAPYWCRAVGRWAAAGQWRVGRHGTAVGAAQGLLFAHPPEGSPLRAHGPDRSNWCDRGSARGATDSGGARSSGASRPDSSRPTPALGVVDIGSRRSARALHKGPRCPPLSEFRWCQSFRTWSVVDRSADGQRFELV